MCAEFLGFLGVQGPRVQGFRYGLGCICAFNPKPCECSVHPWGMVRQKAADSDSRAPSPGLGFRNGSFSDSWVLVEGRSHEDLLGFV